MGLINPIDWEKYPFVNTGYQYAIDIVEGKIIACKYVIGACQRFLREYAKEDATYYFSPEKAERYLTAVQRFEHVIGTWATKNIVYSPWQCFIWASIMGFIVKETGFRRFRLVHCEIGRGNAKAHWIETDVITPDGIKKWKEIDIGSRLYDRNGNICNVVNKNEVHYPDAYEITFSNGTKTICSDQHLWITESKKERDRRQGNSKLPWESAKTTLEIARTLDYGGMRNHSIRISQPVKGEKKISHPYFWGYWIGNGTIANTVVTCHKEDCVDVFEKFLSSGVDVGLPKEVRNKNAARIPSYGLQQERIKYINSFGEKSIHQDVFFAVEEDRMEFLKGLMDSDGNCHRRQGLCTYSTKHERLALQVNMLVNGLGIKSTVQKDFRKSRNKTYYKVSFTPSKNVFSLKRKSDQIKYKNTGINDRLYINEVKKVDNIYPMFCVEVDSPDSSYLITDQYIPTHNSTMASTALLYFLALDENIQGNQIATVATKKDQARIVLDAARAMAKKAPRFLLEKGVKVLAHSIVQEESNSVARALSARDDGLDGLNDVLAICDELHAMSREVFDVIYSGMSKRKDSLTLCITTAGFDMDSVGYSQSQYAKKVCTGEIEDEQMFAIVYTLDEEDTKNNKNIFNPDVWIKANPSYGGSVDPVTLLAKAKKAKDTPADLPNFLTKHMNVWCQNDTAFFDVQKFKECANPEMKLSDFKGQKCRVGVDISSHIDLTSIVILFKKDGLYHFFDKSYIPEVTVDRVRNTLYDNCIGLGFLIKTPGEAIDQEYLEKEVMQIVREFRVEDCLLDPWNAVNLMQRLEKKRVPVTEFRMNVSNLSEPTKTLDSLIRKNQVRYNGSPLLEWCLGNVVCKYDAASNVYPRKPNEKMKIDPVIGMLMALASLLQEEQKSGIYTGERGLRFL